MFRRLLPKKEIFFEYMEAQADKAVEAAAALRTLFDDLDNVEQHRDRVKEIEHEADAIAHKAIGELHRTFITPLDRNEINRMLKRLDDITDLLESVAQRMYYYELKRCPAPVKGLLDVVEKQVVLVREVVGGLSDLRNTDEMRTRLVELHTLENEADAILRPAIADLFREQENVAKIIKWKEVYEHLERATDRCEDIADLVENILLEYA